MGADITDLDLQLRQRRLCHGILSTSSDREHRRQEYSGIATVRNRRGKKARLLDRPGTIQRCYDPDFHFVTPDLHVVNPVA